MRYNGWASALDHNVEPARHAARLRPRAWATCVRELCWLGRGPVIGYPVYDQAMRVLDSESSECSEKMREPRAMDAGSQCTLVVFGDVAFKLGVAVAEIGGRYANSKSTRSAKTIPVLLYPPERSFTIDQTSRTISARVLVL